VTFVVGQAPPSAEPVAPLRRRARQVAFTGVASDSHLSEEMLDRFPRARSGNSLALDLGCGSGVHRAVCERAGFQWVGLDYSFESAPIWGDAHALPFADNSFEFIVSVAVLEHIRYPFVMLQEARRVLKPGGLLLGTVSFLEPFHGNSYYHHTYLGTLSGLLQAGFDVEEIAPSAGTVLGAQADMALFPRAPRSVQHALVAPLDALHRLWWRAGRIVDPSRSENERLQRTTRAFIFAVTRPASSSTIPS
jgi:SAM-dependent methyltransferase